MLLRTGDRIMRTGWDPEAELKDALAAEIDKPARNRLVSNRSARRLSVHLRFLRRLPIHRQVRVGEWPQPG